MTKERSKGAVVARFADGRTIERDQTTGKQHLIDSGGNVETEDISQSAIDEIQRDEDARARER